MAVLSRTRTQVTPIGSSARPRPNNEKGGRFALLIIVLALLVVPGCRSENRLEESVAPGSEGPFIHDDPPARSVPSARLVEPVSAAGQLLSYTWAKGGRIRSVTPRGEVNWLPKVSLRGASTTVISLSTGVMPVRIWSRFFDEIQRSGIPKGTLGRFACEPQTNKSNCSLMVTTRENEILVTTPVPSNPGPEVMVLYAAWHVPGPFTLGTPEYSASWGFRIAD